MGSVIHSSELRDIDLSTDASVFNDTQIENSVNVASIVNSLSMAKANAGAVFVSGATIK